MSELNSILIVDDSEDVRELARISLENIGEYDVEVAHDSESALAKLQSSRTDVVLLDCVLENESGIDLMKVISAKFPETAVIFLTARVSAEEVETYLSMGAIGVISKPFDALKLAETVANVWRGR